MPLLDFLGLTEDQLMGIGSGLAGFGQGMQQGGISNGFAGANQGLLNFSNMQQQRQLMELRKRQMAMAEAQAQREQMKFDREGRADDALRVSLTGDYTGGLLGPDMPRAEGMAPAGGLLATLPQEQRGILGAMAQSNPQAVASSLVQRMMTPEETLKLGPGEAAFRVNKGTGQMREVARGPEKLPEFLQTTDALGIPRDQAGRLFMQRETKPLVQMSQPFIQESEFSKTLGGGTGKAAMEIMSDADRATDQLGLLRSMRAFAQKWREAGGSLGAGAPLEKTVTAAMQATGLSPRALGLPDDAGPAQVIASLTNKLAMANIGTGGLPANNFSEADRNFLVDTKANLRDTPEGFFGKVILDEAAARRALIKEEMWAKARMQGKSYEQFRSEWREFVNKTPLFAPDQMAEIKALAAPPTPQQAGPRPTATGPKGEKLILSPDGKSWIDASK